MNTAFGAAALAGILVGAALVSTEAAVADVGPGLLGLLRYAIGLAIMLPFALSSMRPIPRRDFVPIAVIGAGQFGIQLVLLNVAVLYDSSARAALIFATLPVASLFVGAVLGIAWPGRTALFGGLLVVAGVATSLWDPGLFVAGEGTTWFGIAMATAATLTGATCSLLLQPYLRRYGSFPVGVIATTVSLLPLGLFAALETGGSAPGQWDAEILTHIGFVGLASGIGFMLWLYALTRAAAARVTSFLALSPMAAALLSWVLLGENPGLRFIPAALLVAGGLSLAARQSQLPVDTDSARRQLPMG